MKVSELMFGIKTMDMVLPEFQREYVWTRDQAKKLITSLIREYPTGSLLIWKTADPPEIKNNAVARDKIGTTSVILDGQQRMTTLYLLTQNSIPPYYRPEDIANDPRNLYFDLESADLQFYQALLMRNNPTWVEVTSCFDDTEIDVFKIAQVKAKEEGQAFTLANQYNTHLNRLRGIVERDYPVQTVPPNADIKDAIDVFDLVNSQGTKLSDAELALAHITSKWPQARREIKKKVEELAELRFRFDITFFVRGLTGVVRRRALFEAIHTAPEAALKEGWITLCKVLDYLIKVLPSWAHIHSTEDLNTTNVLIPPVVFLAHNEGKFGSETDLKLFVRWLYAASSWGRYSGQTDQRLDHDVSLILQSDNPWSALVDAIIDQRGRIELKAADLEGRGTQHPLYRMTYVLMKINGAVDWFNGTPLSSSGLHSHHIFPQSVLYKEGPYSSDNHLHKQKVNEIANRAFLSEDSNLSLSDSKPSKYLPMVDENYPGALQKQFVPLNPVLWDLSQYEEFLQRRREMIAHAYNEQMERLNQAASPPKQRSSEELITAGESATLEFKSTLRWDMHTQQVNKNLEKVIAKTVAGFMNSEGGTLLIGVTDDGSVCGIQNDIHSLKRQDRDGFEQHLVQVLSDKYLSPEFGAYYTTSFEEVDGNTICRIQVDRSPKAVFLKNNQNSEFYIRTGNTTRPLDAQAQFEYIGMHWEVQ